MKLPVDLFKKKSMKWYLFLKAKRQAKAHQHSCTACCLHNEKDLKENVKKKISESLLELICCIFYLRFKNNTTLGYAFLLSVGCFVFIIC